MKLEVKTEGDDNTIDYRLHTEGVYEGIGDTPIVLIHKCSNCGKNGHRVYETVLHKVYVNHKGNLRTLLFCEDGIDLRSIRKTDHHDVVNVRFAKFAIKNKKKLLSDAKAVTKEYVKIMKRAKNEK